jgi:hypothetical protein
LREVLKRVVELAQLVEGYELELSRVNLKSIGKELTEFKGKVQMLTRSYLVSSDPSLVGDAHKLLNEVDEVTNRGQKCIRRLLRWLGVLPEGTEESSLENQDARPRDQGGAGGAGKRGPVRSGQQPGDSTAVSGRSPGQRQWMAYLQGKEHGVPTMQE